MRRTPLTVALLLGLALRPADAHAASDPHAKKPAPAAHRPAKAAPEAHAAPTPASAGHAAKPAATPHFTAKATPPAAKADSHAPKPADSHVAKTPVAHATTSTGHAAKTTDAHAAKPADQHGTAAKAPAPAGEASHAAAPAAGQARAAGTKPLATDLHALSERIQVRIAEVLKEQSSAATASKTRAHTSAAATNPAPRISVDWKISVSWPEGLKPHDTPHEGERVGLSWSGMAP